MLVAELVEVDLRMLSSRCLRCSTSCIGVVGAPAIGAVEEAWPMFYFRGGRSVAVLSAIFVRAGAHAVLGTLCFVTGLGASAGDSRRTAENNTPPCCCRTPCPPAPRVTNDTL